MRRETPFTLVEAKGYITESMDQWENSNQTDKIIALADYAYNRRNKANTASVTSKLKEVQKNIRAIENILKRDEKNHRPSSKALNDELMNLMVEEEKLETLVAKEPPKTPRTRKPKK
jgi:hypothetical protein